MKLRKCYIENFGTLSGRTFEFGDGLTVLQEDNGFGKSTLAVFIKAMLYGLPKTTKRSLDDNEREKYRPWQGGKYGGYMEFEANGKAYRAERFFAARGSDSFKLYDLSHNGESDDFSDRLGEELFGVDAASYEKSTFLPQKEVAAGMTGSLNAKIGNLVDDTDDLNNYESAYALLEKASRRYALKRGEGGLIFETRRKLTEQSLALSKCEESFEAAERLSHQSEELEEKLASLRKKAAENAEIERQWQNQRLQQEQWKHYRSLIERGQKARAEYEQKLSLCGGSFPDRIALEEAAAYLQELESLKAKLPENASPELEALNEFFCNGLPDEEELEVVGPYCAEYEFKLQKLRDFPDAPNDSGFFQNGLPNVSEYEPLLASNVKPALPAAVLGAGAVLAAIGIALLVLKNNFALIPLIIGVIAAAAGGILLMKKLQKLKAQKAFLSRFFSDVSQPEQCIREFYRQLELHEDSLREAERLAKEKAELLSEVQQQKAVLQSFFAPFYPHGGEDFSALAEDLNRKLLEHEFLLKQQAKLSEDEAKRQQQMADLTEKLSSFLRQYHQPEGMPKASLQVLREAVSSGEALLKTAADSFSEGERYRQEKGLTEEPLLTEEPQIEDVSEELSALSDEKTRLQLQYAQLLRQAEPMQDLKGEIAKLTDEVARYSAEHRGINEALTLLQKAKENLSGKYVNVIERRLQVYLAQLDPEFSGVSVDRELNITVDRFGEKKRFGYFSRGYRNLLEICLRMSLIDAMYQLEQPFLILDDPFVNLDDQKIIKAKEMLARLSEDRQIIYLTCHSSRA